jgi:nicotinamide phosphoribosyltransferase
MKLANLILTVFTFVSIIGNTSSETNFILDTDSYKASHWIQYPEGTTATFSYLESRGGKYDKIVFFGLQYILKKYFSQRITPEMVEEARLFFAKHGEPFNDEGWSYIANELEGKLPIRIRAVPEGTLVPTSNVLITVESTDPKAYWLPSWVETQLVRVWYPTTVATVSWHCKHIIKKYLDLTSDHPDEEIEFKLHDFGSRGVSSRESAEIGGAAHLINFKGSDTVMGVVCANQYYLSEMSGFSIPAAEHSTITSYGKEHEIEAYRNMLKHFAKPNSLVAVVSDSYDLYHAVDNLWGQQLRQEIIQSGATVIIRPDSGNPPEVVLKTVQLLDKHFGHTVNLKGFKVLNHVRVIQGDGIHDASIQDILETLTKAGYSATNVAFGMGGALLQKMDRDTQKFAYKCSCITIHGEEREIFKAPMTDPGKHSKKGKLDLIYDGSGFTTVRGTNLPGSILRTVYENGEVKIEDTLEEIRVRSRK